MLGKAVTAVVMLLVLVAAMATADKEPIDNMLFLRGEMNRWNLVKQQARKAGLSLAGFYHTSAWMPNWQGKIRPRGGPPPPPPPPTNPVIID